jgi:hypothetical protein
MVSPLNKIYLRINFEKFYPILNYLKEFSLDCRRQ